MILIKRITFLLFLFGVSHSFAQVQVDKFSGDASYGLPLITVPNFRGPSISTSLFYRSDIKVDQAASEVGLGWDLNAGGSIERSVRGVPDDWNGVNTADVNSASFQDHYGALHFDKVPANSGTSNGDVLDFSYTRYKMDTLNDSIRYHYINYDSYYVVGGGMSGEISPENYNYAQVKTEETGVKRWFYYETYIELLSGEPHYRKDSTELDIRETTTYTIDPSNDFSYKTHFRYNHNNYAEVDSRYFPWNESPISSTTDFKIPGETVNGSTKTYEGNGYNDENHVHSLTKNRSRTANYIEYYTNAELHTGVTGFLEYDGAFDRSDSTTFPADGIGAYQIVGPDGYTYHYSLPVYSHYTISGNFSLDKNHEIIIAEGGKVEKNENADGSYLLENDFTNEVLESKQSVKYAIRWLLTAITGPDFEDANNNGMVDLSDKGYWVKYDYGLWTESFEDRFPYYGASYSFSKGVEEDLSAFMDNNDENSNSGKLLAYSETASQKYYLNQIQTPSHTGILVRDYRNDEQSGIPLKTTELDDPTVYVDSNLPYGNLNALTSIDDHSGAGRMTSTHSGGASFTHTFNIKPTDYGLTYNSIDLTLQTATFIHSGVDFDIEVYDGLNGTGSSLLHRYDGDGDGTTATTVHSNSGIISIVIDVTPFATNGNQGTIYNGMNFDINWDISWQGEVVSPKRKPQLRLTQLLLIDNEDLINLPAITTLRTISNDGVWEYSELNLSSCYNSDWYTANKTTIDGLALQSVVLEQNYTLAKGYNNNRYVNIDADLKTTNQIEVESAKTIESGYFDESGKLTLNKVIYYGLNRSQTQPAHLFDYHVTDVDDNPDYNSLKQDYWGNYKSDASGNLLRGYVTDVSKEYTSAWSLRKITSPLGGITEIIYESDEYEQVLAETFDGGLRGPSKTFAIEGATAITGSVGYDWTFNMENEETEFWNLFNNIPSGTVIETVIPGVWIDPTKEMAEQYNGSSEYFPGFQGTGAAVSYGNGVLSSSPNTITGLSYYDITGGVSAASVGLWGPELTYAGEGYVALKYPIGEKIYGGGTRVKELKVSGETDTYKVAYTYEQGTATDEVNDFTIGKIKQDEHDNWYHVGLTSFETSPFGLNPQVGYGEVSIENKGQSTTSQGKTNFTFHVYDQDRSDYQPYVQKKYTTENRTVGPTTYTDEKSMFAVEIIDDFTTLWGKIKEQTLEDVNQNQISKKIYGYATSTKGAHVSAINFETGKSTVGGPLIESYNLCIYRKYPTYLNTVTTYSNGQKSESTIMDRDPFTGIAIATKSTSVNGTENTEEVFLAYQQTTPNYEVMGPKSDNPTNHNFLNATYATKTARKVPSVITNDFSSYGKSFWKETATVHYYDATTGTFKTRVDPVNWYDYTQYTWTGPLGNYGLFDATVFTDINAVPTGTSDWRFISEITLMDEQQNVLEQKGYNNRYSASKLAYDNRFTYTSASNANYASFTATGFETLTEVDAGVNYAEGEVFFPSDNLKLGVDGTVTPHTGNFLVKVPTSTNDGPSYTVQCDGTAATLQAGRTYSASVWVHRDSPNDAKLSIELIGTTGTSYTNSVSMRRDDAEAIQVGDWVQLNVNIAIPDNFTTPSPFDGVKVMLHKTSASAAWFDDLQFKSRVTGSGMNVYDQKTGRVMATLSDNNFATKYVYNDAGQVMEVWKEVLGDTWGEWVKVESRDFNFQRAME